MIRWQWRADNPALQTAVGVRRGDAIAVSEPGTALFGPYVELPAGLYRARVQLAEPGEGKALLDVTSHVGQATLARAEVDLASALEIEFELAAEAPAVEVRLHATTPVRARITGVEIDALARPAPEPLDPARRVGTESSKSYAEKVRSGFFARYLSRDVLEIGHMGGGGDGAQTIVPGAIGVDIGYAGYDGRRLPFADESFDAVYASHCLEHIDDYQAAFAEWFRVLKVGGHLVVIVPHHHLYERRDAPPSPWNADHKRFYSPETLTREVAESLAPNAYRLRHLADNDAGYDYAAGTQGPLSGCYELEMVLQKRAEPNWKLDDGTVRGYSAAEFVTLLPRPTPWTIEKDFGAGPGFLIQGPRIALRPGAYTVEFRLSAEGLDQAALDRDMDFDIAQDGMSFASCRLSGEPGARMLREGRVLIPFTHYRPNAFVEFRISALGVPFHGKLIFEGAILRHA